MWKSPKIADDLLCIAKWWQQDCRIIGEQARVHWNIYNDLLKALWSLKKSWEKHLWGKHEFSWDQRASGFARELEKPQIQIAAQSRVSHGFSPGCSGPDPARVWNTSRLETALGRNCSTASLILWGKRFSVFPVWIAGFSFCHHPAVHPWDGPASDLPWAVGAAAGSPQSHPLSSLKEPQPLSLSS